MIKRTGTDHLPQDLREFIDSHRVGRLATASAAGEPHVIPLCYARMDDRFFFVVDEKPKRRGKRVLKRLANIEENPTVALVIDDYDDDWSRLAFLLLHLNAEKVQHESEYAAALEALRERYAPYRQMELAFATHPMIRMTTKRWVFWRASG